MTKDNVLKVINELPDIFELDTLFERLILIDKTPKELDQLNDEIVISHDKVKKLIK